MIIMVMPVIVQLLIVLVMFDEILARENVLVALLKIG